MSRRPVRHAELGATLRRAREAVQPPLSGNKLAQRLGWDQAKVSLLESGRQTPTEADVTAWAEATGADPAALLDAREHALVRRLDIREAARRPGGVEALQGDLENLEAGSSTIAEYQPMLVPGLAQIPDYTRAWLNQPDRVELGGTVDVEEIVARRAGRQRRLHDRTIVAAVHPTALTAVYGTVQVQRAQLDALVTAVDNKWLELIVTPQPLAILQGFELLDDLVIVESTVSAHVMGDPSVLERFRGAFRRLRRQGRIGRDALTDVERARAVLDENA